MLGKRGQRSWTEDEVVQYGLQADHGGTAPMHLQWNDHCVLRKSGNTQNQKPECDNRLGQDLRTKFCCANWLSQICKLENESTSNWNLISVSKIYFIFLFYREKKWNHIFRSKMWCRRSIISWVAYTAGLSLVVRLLLLTSGLSPEMGFSCWFWIFCMLPRHSMGKCSYRKLLVCGWAVKASKRLLLWDHWIVSIKPGSCPQNAGSLMGLAQR